MPTLDTPGASLLYSRSGDGPPVLLIQGVGVVGNGWTPQVDRLRERFTLVSFDNRGIGASVNRDGRLTIDDMAADALAILDAEGIDRVHVAGHSMGGVIAQALALRAPARIKSLALLCTFAKGKDGSKVTLPMLATALRMRVGTRAMRRNAFLELIMPERYLQQTDRPALAARLAPLFGHDLAEQPPIVMKQLGAMSKYERGAAASRAGDNSNARRLGHGGPHRLARDRARARGRDTRREVRRDPGGRSRSADPPARRNQRAPGRALDAGRTPAEVVGGRAGDVPVTNNPRWSATWVKGSA